MAEQRPAFRFRLPWLLPSEPAAPPPRPPVPTPQTVTPATTTTTNQSPIPPTPAAPPPRPPVPTTQTVTPATTTTQAPIPPTQAAPLPRPPVPTTQTVTPATTTTQTPIPPTQVAPRPRPPVPTPQSVNPATTATSTQTPIPPTPTQTPPTTTPRTPALRPPTTTQTPVPPTPTTQRPPITTSQTSTPLTSAQRPPTTTQTPIPPNPTQRPSTTTQTLIPPTLAPRSPTTTQILNSATPTQRPLSTPLGLAPSEPPPPPPPPTTQSPTSTKPEPALVKIPSNQPTDVTQSPTDPPSPATPPQRPPFRPAGATQSQTSSPKAQASPRNESQPSSPFRAGTQSRANSQPPSPSRIATQSRVSSQPASPSRVGTQSRVPSLSPSPSRATTQSRAASQPLSPSRQTTQSKTASQPSSPSRKQQSQTGSSPRSPSKLVSQPTGKISSLPSSPAKTSTKIEPPEDSVAQPPSSRTIQQIDKAIPPPNFNDPEPLISEKGEQKVTPPPLESQEPRPNTETTIDNTSNNHNSHKLRATETTTQPNVLVPTDLPHMTEKSDSIPSSSDLALPRDKPEAKKEPQQKIDDSVVEYGEIEEKTVAELIAKLSKSKAQTKEQPSFVVQTNQKQPEKQLHSKEQYTTSMSNGRETKTTTPHTVDKSPVSESRQRPVTSNNGAQVPLHKEIRDDISRFAQKMATTHPKKPMDEKSMTVITIAGENRGALMHLGSEMAKREGAIHIRRGYKINPDESGDTTDGEGSSRGRRQKDSITREDKASKAYVNNNTQGVNNSIVFNSSIAQGSPGVHLTITRHLPKPNKSNHETEPLEARKAEFNITPAQKLTYEPIVRRRCLRGLFLESSDSDDDNPEKPRRHGCRYGCGDKSKDGEIDVL